MNLRIALLCLGLSLAACSDADVAEPFMGSFSGNVTFTFTPDGGDTTVRVFTNTTVNGEDLTKDSDDSADVGLDGFGDANCYMSGPVSDELLSIRDPNCSIHIDQAYYDLSSGIGTATINGDALTIEHSGEYRLRGTEESGSYVYSFAGQLVSGSR
jgi:hypothetical protein